MNQQTKDLDRSNTSRIEHTFKPNDYVFVQAPNIESLGKFDQRYFGPYKLLQVSQEKNTAVCNIDGTSTRVNFRRLKPYRGKPLSEEPGCHNLDPDSEEHE
jgi:hypothetical protein